MLDRTPGLACGGSAGDVEEALRELHARDIALIIVEPLASPSRERDLIRSLGKAAPSVPILAFSAREESGYVARLLEAGVVAFVSKKESRDRLLVTLRAALESPRP